MRDIGAFEPHHERDPIFSSLTAEDAVDDDVATHHAAEDVDQDSFHVAVGEDDPQRRRDLLARAPPPTSRKCAGSPPCSLIRSIVLMARQAPFTGRPRVPSSFT